MPAITQRVDNYLGGVSRQSDDKKLPGQVKECLNGYPDPTFGLVKRPGFKWISNLGTGSDYDSSKWFYISRTANERYIGCIRPKQEVDNLGDIKIWNAGTGAVCNVYYDGVRWKTSTDYSVGDVISNGTKIYECITAGTSADSGSGPSGEGSDITDGSGNLKWKWKYNQPKAKQYLSLNSTRLNYDVLTVQDTSIISNNSSVISELAAPTYTADTGATLILSGTVTGSVDVYSFKLKTTGDNAIDVTISVTAAANDTYDDVLGDLRAEIDSQTGFDTDNIFTKNDTLFFRQTNGDAFTVTDVQGGPDNSKLNIVRDTVDNVGQLPIWDYSGHKIEVINTDSDKDTYWAEFVTTDGSTGYTLGEGYWQETVSPKVSLGLDASTMPHELVNTATDEFVFRQIVYEPRKVGDSVTNSSPSFVGSKIEQSFFYSNRLGFLSQDNVILSQSGAFYNFYHKSALTIVDSDPVDLSTSTTRPASLHGVIPTTQGLVLFSKNQQFLMSADDGILTPTRTSVRTISSYEMDENVDPVDTGTVINFITKTPNYTRIFGMATRGQNENPEVLDIGRVVNEWIPATVDTFIASTVNQFIAMSSQSSDKIYFYRTYSDGEKLLVQAWYNWQLPGTVQGMAVDSDDLFIVTKQTGATGVSDQVTLSKASLSQSPEDAILVNSQGERINPCMDLYATASKVLYVTKDDLSKCYIPWNKVKDATPVLLISGSTATGNFVESGFTITPSVKSDPAWERDTQYEVGDFVSTNSDNVYTCVVAGTSANDGDGPGSQSDSIVDGTARWDWERLGSTYFEVPKKDITSVADDVNVGWKYDFDITLPKTYVKLDDAAKRSDFTSTLTIARMKFSCGLSGVMGFKLKSTGINQGSRKYTAYPNITKYNWDASDFTYVDKDQIKVKINGIESSDFSVTGDYQITLDSVSGTTELFQGTTGNPVTTKYNASYTLGFTPKDDTRIKVELEDENGEWQEQTSGYSIIENYLTFHPDSVPPSEGKSIRVYSADDIEIYLDEWYDLNPIAKNNNYLANEVPLLEQQIFTLPIHQKTDNFQIRLFNDSPFPVSLNSMMWEGVYSPRFYRRT